jgi:threonine aldolase
MTALVEGERGVFTPEQVEAATLPSGSLNNASTPLVCLENTHNRGSGRVWPLETFQAVVATARSLGLNVHLDGARLLNAVVASRVPASVWAAEVDTLWVDLSKGLGAPVGAVLAGNGETIERARRYKQMFGGAMRQAGIIAAGGIYALEHNIKRLAEDHEHAQLFARGLLEIPGIQLNPTEVETNIVFFDVSETGLTAQEFNEQMKADDVRMAAGGYGSTLLRAVTHLNISKLDVDRVLELAANVIRSAA